MVSEAARAGVVQEVVGRVVAVPEAEDLVEEAVVADAEAAAAGVADLAVVPEDEAGGAAQTAAGGFSVSR